MPGHRRERQRDDRRDSRGSPPRRRRERSRSRSRSSSNRKWGRDSRSPSRSSSLELPREVVEERRQRQVIRVAAREGRLMEPDVSAYWMRMEQKEFQALTKAAEAPSRIKEPILVRELFIGGLNERNVSMRQLHEVMSTYGQVENIEHCRNFIFVKYQSVQDASNACSNYQNINLNLHGAPTSSFKMFFSDFSKRYNVVGDARAVERKENMIPVLFVAFRGDSHLDQSHLRKIFGKYGPIRGLIIQREENIPSAKVVSLIEFEELEDALRARDRVLRRKDKLRDKNCEISVLLDTTKYPPNQTPTLPQQDTDTARLRWPCQDCPRLRTAPLLPLRRSPRPPLRPWLQPCPPRRPASSPPLPQLQHAATSPPPASASEGNSPSARQQVPEGVDFVDGRGGLAGHGKQGEHKGLRVVLHDKRAAASTADLATGHNDEGLVGDIRGPEAEVERSGWGPGIGQREGATVLDSGVPAGKAAGRGGAFRGRTRRVAGAVEGRTGGCAGGQRLIASSSKSTLICAQSLAVGTTANELCLRERVIKLFMTEEAFQNDGPINAPRLIHRLETTIMDAFEDLNQSKKNFESLKELKKSSKDIFIQNLEDLERVCLEDLRLLQEEMNRKQLVTKAEFSRIVDRIQALHEEQQSTKSKFDGLEQRLGTLRSQIGKLSEF